MVPIAHAVHYAGIVGFTVSVMTDMVSYRTYLFSNMPYIIGAIMSLCVAVIVDMMLVGSVQSYVQEFRLKSPRRGLLAITFFLAFVCASISGYFSLKGFEQWGKEKLGAPPALSEDETKSQFSAYQQQIKGIEARYKPNAQTESIQAMIDKSQQNIEAYTAQRNQYPNWKSHVRKYDSLITKERANVAWLVSRLNTVNQSELQRANAMQKEKELAQKSFDAQSQLLLRIHDEKAARYAADEKESKAMSWVGNFMVLMLVIITAVVKGFITPAKEGFYRASNAAAESYSPDEIRLKVISVWEANKGLSQEAIAERVNILLPGANVYQKKVSNIIAEYRKEAEKQARLQQVSSFDYRSMESGEAIEDRLTRFPNAPDKEHIKVLRNAGHDVQQGDIDRFRDYLSRQQNA